MYVDLSEIIRSVSWKFRLADEHSTYGTNFLTLRSAIFCSPMGTPSMFPSPSHSRRSKQKPEQVDLVAILKVLNMLFQAWFWTANAKSNNENEMSFLLPATRL